MSVAPRIGPDERGGGAEQRPGHPVDGGRGRSMIATATTRADQLSRCQVGQARE
jgi:hypothetical protein